MRLPIIDPETDDFTITVSPRVYSTGNPTDDTLTGLSMILYTPGWESGDTIYTEVVTPSDGVATVTIPNASIPVTGVYQAAFYATISGVQKSSGKVDVFEVRNIG